MADTEKRINESGHLNTSLEASRTELKIYQIGSFIFSVEKPLDLPSPDNLSLFLYHGKEEPYLHYTLREIPFDGEVLDSFYQEFKPIRENQREDCRILQNESHEARLVSFHGSTVPYGIYRECSDNQIEILVDTAVRDMLIYDTVFLSLFGLEKQMINQDALVLHCAYMLRNGGAVLFTAPSGTGKSTQADLWEDYRGTRTINGDKSLLYRHEDGLWYANGWPICGSSEICHNESYPIEAIVVIHQARDNAIRSLHGLEAVKKLMAQITINMWNPSFQIRAMDLIDELVKNIPIYELGCDISENAVTCLERVLEREK